MPVKAAKAPSVEEISKESSSCCFRHVANHTITHDHTIIEYHILIYTVFAFRWPCGRRQNSTGSIFWLSYQRNTDDVFNINMLNPFDWVFSLLVSSFMKIRNIVLLLQLTPWTEFLAMQFLQSRQLPSLAIGCSHWWGGRWLASPWLWRTRKSAGGGEEAGAGTAALLAKFSCREAMALGRTVKWRGKVDERINPNQIDIGTELPCREALYTLVGIQNLGLK